MSEETSYPMAIEQILEILPHRFPFLMIDRVLEAVAGSHALCIKNVTINEHHFQGHFPKMAVMPGVLIIEAFAQASAVAVVKTSPEAAGKMVYFMSVDEARFRKPVVPGDQLYLRATLIKNRSNIWKFDCEGTVDGKVVAEAVVTAMVLDR